MQPVMINGQMVEILDYFKNLGTYINVFLILRKTLATFLRNAHNASTLLHKLNNFGVSQNILEIVFQSLVQSVSFITGNTCQMLLFVDLQQQKLNIE